jgi:hypothetical protein
MRLVRLNEVKYTDNEAHIQSLIEDGFVPHEVVEDDEPKPARRGRQPKAVADDE